MTKFVPPQIRTRHDVLPSIRLRSLNKNISKFWGVNLRTVQIIRKKFGEFNGDNEGTASQETRSARSDKKRTAEFVDEIKTTTDNDPSKSVRAIARDTGVSEFLNRQTVPEDIRYFSYKMYKNQQNSALCHTSRRTIALLSDNFSDHISSLTYVAT